MGKKFFKLTRIKIIIVISLLFVGFISCFAGKILTIAGGVQPFYIPILKFFCLFSNSYYGVLKGILFIIGYYLISCIIEYIRTTPKK